MSIEQQILKYLQQDGAELLKPRALARRLGESKKDRQRIEEAVESLIAAGQLQQTPQGHVLVSGTTTRKKGQLVGTIRRTFSGAWFTPQLPGGEASDRSQDLFIYPEDLADAHDRDTVLVHLKRSAHPGARRTGRVDEVLNRATHTFVGTYSEDHSQGRVIVDGGAFTEPVIVGDPGAKGARPGDKVVIEMVRFPSATRPGEAVLTRVLGPGGDPGVDELTIIHELALPEAFPEDVLEEARLAADRFDPLDHGNRLDLTHEPIVTIDPVDARDFDDAISLRRTEDGHWHLGVHIADVGHFVPVGSRLDEEARRRGTSVYLPGRVLPMIPETISNSLASLQQGQPRFTKTVLIEFSAEGVPLHTEFHNSVIKVTQRFAYEQVMPILRDPQKHRDLARPAVRQLLKRMHELAMILRKRRFDHGAIELYLPEVKIELGAGGEVTGVREVVNDESHQIIEEFMLAANIAVATALQDREVRFLRRVHARPDPVKLQTFANFVSSLGFHPVQEPQRERSKKEHSRSHRSRSEKHRHGADRTEAHPFWSREALQRIVADVKGQPLEQAVNYALLRSMKQAQYTGEPVGHYALAAEHYCHFTSPIRRYPDLTVHRLFEQVIAAESSGSTESASSRGPLTVGKNASRRRSSKHSADGSHPVAGLGEEEARQLGEQCSTLERRAERAERELIRIKLLRLLSQKMDQDFPALITGVERAGLFCRGVSFPVDGFLPLASLAPGETIDFDRATYTMTARRSGRVYRMGDSLLLRIAKIDPEQRSLTWQLAQPTSSALPGSRVKKEAHGHRSRSEHSPAHRNHPDAPATGGPHPASGSSHGRTKKARPAKQARKRFRDQ